MSDTGKPAIKTEETTGQKKKEDKKLEDYSMEELLQLLDKKRTSVEEHSAWFKELEVVNGLDGLKTDLRKERAIVKNIESVLIDKMRNKDVL